MKKGGLWVVLTLAFEWHFAALPDGAFVGEHCGGVQRTAGGTEPVAPAIFARAPWMAWRLRRVSANHGKEDWLGGRVAVTFRRLAWNGGKSGVKPPPAT